MNLKLFQFPDHLNRKEKLLRVTLFFLIGGCFTIGLADFIRDLPIHYSIYNLSFSVLFLGMYLWARN